MTTARCRSLVLALPERSFELANIPQLGIQWQTSRLAAESSVWERQRSTAAGVARRCDRAPSRSARGAFFAAGSLPKKGDSHPQHRRCLLPREAKAGNQLRAAGTISAPLAFGGVGIGRTAPSTPPLVAQAAFTPARRAPVNSVHERFAKLSAFLRRAATLMRVPDDAPKPATRQTLRRAKACAHHSSTRLPRRIRRRHCRSRNEPPCR
jgi:hypothetical protein